MTILFPELWVYRYSFNMLLRLIAAVLTFLTFSSCATSRYLMQAFHGQISINNRARDLDHVLRDEATEPEVYRALQEMPRIKDYGRKQGLKITSNYNRYLDLKRDSVVWAVRGSKELSFDAKNWHFPIVGSIPYLGWFDQQSAKDFAAQLKREGWEVNVRGVPAYSTLGYFEDPLLNTMLEEGELAMGALVDVLLHESVHATLYVPGQPIFNESLASFMANTMTPHYLAKYFGEQSAELRAYNQAMGEGNEKRKRLHAAYVELDLLYKSKKSDDQKRAIKAQVFSRLQKEMGYENPPNNAFLMVYKTYRSGFEDFARLYRACGKDWLRFKSAILKTDESTFREASQQDMGPVVDKLLPFCANKL